MPPAKLEQLCTNVVQYLECADFNYRLLPDYRGFIVLTIMRWFESINVKAVPVLYYFKTLSSDQGLNPSLMMHVDQFNDLVSDNIAILV